MEPAYLLQRGVVRSVSAAGEAWRRATMRARKWLETARAYRRAYFISRDFRRLTS